MGAMQAQDFGMSFWAIGSRIQGSTFAQVEQAYNRGDILRTHALRPTWQLVTAEDIRWIISLTRPQILSSIRSRQKELGLTEAVFNKTARILEMAMKGNHHLTREEIGGLLSGEGVDLKDNRLSHLLMWAELEGLICSGPLKRNKITYALFSERVPKSAPISKEEALEKLAKRYFSSRYPATLADFTWWSGLTARDARKAFEMAKTSADEWEATGIPGGCRCVLAAAFDEYVISYKDRSAIISGEHLKRAISMNGIFRPVAIIDGRAAGIWKRTVKKDRIIIEATLFQKINKAGLMEIEQAAAWYGAFYGKQVEINIQTV